MAADADAATLPGLAAAYYDIRAGIGFNKSPDVYGAFPTDPYSHTPKGQGAKQPGMTGQVKEEILTRLGELGVRVVDGCITFDPILLRREELIVEPAHFAYVGLDGELVMCPCRATPWPSSSARRPSSLSRRRNLPSTSPLPMVTRRCSRAMHWTGR